MSAKTASTQSKRAEREPLPASGGTTGCWSAARRSSAAGLILRVASVGLLAAACERTALEAHVPLEAELRAILPAGSSLQKLAGGMRFVEGPVWMSDGTLVFSDIRADRLMRWSASAGLGLLREAPAPNGNALDREGRLLTCLQGERCITRAEADGSLRVLVDSFEGKKLSSPNDLAVKSDGTLWFTDPPYGLRGRPRELDGNFVFRFDPSTNALDVVARDLDEPNGICFSPDESRLYVSGSGRLRQIWVYEVVADRLVRGRVFADLAPARGDGMASDEAGRLYCAAEDGLRLYRPDGALIALLHVPEEARNLCFGGPEGRTLFVTAGTALYALQTLVRGG